MNWAEYLISEDKLEDPDNSRTPAPPELDPYRVQQWIEQVRLARKQIFSKAKSPQQYRQHEARKNIIFEEHEDIEDYLDGFRARQFIKQQRTKR